MKLFNLLRNIGNFQFDFILQHIPPYLLTQVSDPWSLIYVVKLCLIKLTYQEEIAFRLSKCVAHMEIYHEVKTKLENYINPKCTKKELTYYLNDVL